LLEEEEEYTACTRQWLTLVCTVVRKTQNGKNTARGVMVLAWSWKLRGAVMFQSRKRSYASPGVSTKSTICGTGNAGFDDNPGSVGGFDDNPDNARRVATVMFLNLKLFCKLVYIRYSSLFRLM
jgi:hypothetical protein